MSDEAIRLRVRIMEYEARAAMSDKPPLTGREFQREVGDDLDKWTDQMAESAERHGFRVEHEWLRSWLSQFRDAVLKAKPKPILEE